MKKFISLFLILILTLSFSNIQIFADEIPDDYGPPIAKISMSPDLNITTNTAVSMNANMSVTYNNHIAEEQWENKQNYYPAGLNTVRLRVKDDLNNWSQWTELTFVVVTAPTQEEDQHPPIAKITMIPDLVIRENQIVTLSASDSIIAPGRTLAEEQWENKQDSYTVGVHTVRLRVKDSAGEWSQWTEFTFTVIPNDNIQTERPEEDGPIRISELTEGTSIGGTIMVDESMTFDLTQLSFLVRYTDDSTKNISVYDTDVSIDSRYRNSARITGSKKLIFYPDAEYNEVSVTFSYYESGVTIYTTVNFKYDERLYYGKVIDIKATQTNIEIAKDEIFYFDYLDFVITFDTGRKETFTGSDLGFYLPAQYKDMVYVDTTTNYGGKKIMPSENAKAGDTFFIQFSVNEDDYEEDLQLQNPEKFFCIINFTVTDSEEEDEYSDIKAITPLDPVISLIPNEFLDIKSLGFLAHMKSGQTKSLAYSSFIINIQYADRKYVDYNDSDYLIRFKENTPYGTKVAIDFTYLKKSTAKKATVILVYEKHQENTEPGKRPLFTDINGHWAQSDIIQMSLKDMLVGHTMNKFFPDKYTTREEVAVFIYKYLELDEYDFDDSVNIEVFTDISKYHQSMEYISKVHAVGILQGYEDGTFRPSSNITREELATVLFRTYQYKTGVTFVGSNTSKFYDDWNIAPWAYDSVYSAKVLKIVQGRNDGNFWPKDYTTRAEIVAILNRMLK